MARALRRAKRQAFALVGQQHVAPLERVGGARAGGGGEAGLQRIVSGEARYRRLAAARVAERDRGGAGGPAVIGVVMRDDGVARP